MLSQHFKTLDLVVCLDGIYTFVGCNSTEWLPLKKMPWRSL